jgi:hypothetical protein
MNCVVAERYPPLDCAPPSGRGGRTSFDVARSIGPRSAAAFLLATPTRRSSSGPIVTTTMPFSHEVEFLRPAVPGSAGVVFQPDLSIISGGPYLPTTTIDSAGIPAYDLMKLTLVSNIPATGEVALSPDGWFLAGMSGYKDGQRRWTFPTRSASVPPYGPGDLQDPKRMLGYPVRPARGEAGYLVARYSYMGEIYIYTVDGLLVATLGGDTRLSPFWPYPRQTPGMEITGLSFDAEHFWPFMFGNDNGNFYLAVGKWHTSIVRLDGLDSIQRVDLGTITVSKQELARTAPLRVESLSREKLKTEVEVHHLSAPVKASPEGWPQKTGTSSSPTGPTYVTPLPGGQAETFGYTSGLPRS